LDVLGIEGRDNANTSGVVAVSSKFCLCFLVVPVMSEIRIGGDMWRSRGRPRNENVNGTEGGGVGDGVMEVAREEEKANVGRVREIVGDEEVAWFNGDTVAGSDKVSPGGDFRADGVEGVMDMGA
jgi:hypothetical protein